MLAVKAANDEWEASNRATHDAAWFRQHVLPGLQKFHLGHNTVRHRVDPWSLQLDPPRPCRASSKTLVSTV
jgi:hypothetical protein